MGWDAAWDEVYRSQAWGRYPGEDLIRFVARNFYGAPDRAQVKILEVGCGPGANLWFMAREGFSVYGIDGSETAIEQARQRLDAECPGWLGKLWVGDFCKLSLADGFVDAVIDNEAVYCNSYESSLMVYSEMARVTRKGGKLFSRTFASGSWGDGTGENVGRDAWVVAEGPLLGKGFSRFTRENDIRALFGGFAVEDVELLTRTMDNRAHRVSEWVITGAKP
jgi:SAM-dependent methyltransferase